jgi:predicted metal-binding protein
VICEAVVCSRTQLFHIQNEFKVANVCCVACPRGVTVLFKRMVIVGYADQRSDDDVVACAQLMTTPPVPLSYHNHASSNLPLHSSIGDSC